MSTVTPFLYQTKTLSNLTWTRSHSICRQQFGRSISRRSFHCSIQKYAYNGYGGLEQDKNNWVSREPTRKRRNTERSRPPPDKGPRSWQGGPSMLKIPFETGRLPKSNYAPNERFVGFEDREFSNYGQEQEDIEFDERDEYIPWGEAEEGEIPDSMNGKPRESTITDTERRAFEKIFSDMFAQTQNSGPINTGQPSPKAAMSKLDTILSDALQNIPDNRKEKELAVNRYPPALRAAAAKAVGLPDSESDMETEGENEYQKQIQKEPDLDHEQLEALRDPERKRVEGLMKNANTDLELWEIMGKEVFSLIPKLGLEDRPTPAPAEQVEKKKGKRKKGKQSNTEKDVKEVEVKEPVAKEDVKEFDKFIIDPLTGKEISALTLYGPLYPSYLLLGLRLLDRSFAKPSPLALSVLPQIKSLGAISHVLGATTQFYNEVLAIYFYRYEDFPNIVRIFKEMEGSAVEYDEETLSFVQNLIKTQMRVADGERGPVVQGLWTMPHYSIENFRYWRNKISAVVRAREEQMDIQNTTRV